MLPALTVAVETATKARKQNPKCLKTASQRLLLATVLDALADGLSTQRQFKDALPKAERALKEYDAVAKAHLRANNEDENFRARRAAALRWRWRLPRGATQMRRPGGPVRAPRTAARACPNSGRAGRPSARRGASRTPGARRKERGRRPKAERGRERRGPAAASFHGW